MPGSGHPVMLSRPLEMLGYATHGARVVNTQSIQGAGVFRGSVVVANNTWTRNT